MSDEFKIESFATRYRKHIASVIMLTAIAGVFFVGCKYKLFGNKINFTEKPELYLFYGFIMMGIFGAFFTRLRAKFALGATIIIAALYFLIFVAGKLARGEL